MRLVEFPVYFVTFFGCLAGGIQTEPFYSNILLNLFCKHCQYIANNNQAYQKPYPASRVVISGIIHKYWRQDHEGKCGEMDFKFLFRCVFLDFGHGYLFLNVELEIPTTCGI